MMSFVRIIVLALAAAFLAACGGGGQTLTLASATPTPTASAASSTTAASSAPAIATAAGTALACTAPSQPVVELTEGPYYKANPPQNAALRTAGVAGTPLTLTGYVRSEERRVGKECRSRWP